jgi:hypothetical protein
VTDLHREGLAGRVSCCDGACVCDGEALILRRERTVASCVKYAILNNACSAIVKRLPSEGDLTEGIRHFFGITSSHANHAGQTP